MSSDQLISVTTDSVKICRTGFAVSLTFDLKITITICLLSPKADASDEAITNLLCEDDKDYGIGKTLA